MVLDACENNVIRYYNNKDFRIYTTVACHSFQIYNTEYKRSHTMIYL